MNKILNISLYLKTGFFDDLLDNFDDVASEHLGIVYEPFEFSLFILTGIVNATNFEPIQLAIPQVEFRDHVLIPQTTMNFTEFFEENQTFYTIHQVALTGVDFALVFLVVGYAMQIYKETFGGGGKDDN